MFSCVFLGVDFFQAETNDVINFAKLKWLGCGLSFFFFKIGFGWLVSNHTSEEEDFLELSDDVIYCMFFFPTARLG